MIAVVSSHLLRWFTPLLLLAVVLWLSLGTAAAHAELVDAHPAPGSALPAFSDEITLTFTETVDPSLSQLLLLASDGSGVDLDVADTHPTDPRVLTTALADDGSLAAGTYTLVWSTYSTEDDHVSSGSFSFSVGTGVTPDHPGRGSIDSASAAILGKWLELIGVVLLTGLALFLGTARTLLSVPSEWRVHPFLVLGCIGLIGALVSFRARQTATSGSGFFGSLDPDTFGKLLDATYGHAWLVRVLGLLGVLVIASVTRRANDRGTFLTVAIIGAGMLISIAVSGHAAAIGPAWAAIGVDFLHMAGAAVWLGGLLGLLLIAPVREPDEWKRLLGSQGRRFLVAVLLIAFSGSLTVWWQIGGRRQLTGSEYGQTLLIKLAMVAILLGVAVFSRRVLQGERPRLEWVPVAIGLELVLAMVVLLLSADLSQTIPANRPLPVDVAARAIELDSTGVDGASTVRLSGVLTGDPTDVLLIDVSPSGEVQRVIVRSSFSESTSSASVGDRFDVEPVASAPGSYSFPAGRLGIAGEWLLEVSVRRAGIEDDVVTFLVDTSGLEGRDVTLAADRWGGVRPTGQTALALGLAVLMLVLGLAGLKRITGLEPLASGFLLAASLLIAGGFLVSGVRGLAPATPQHGTANPVEPDAATLTYAGELYRLNCLACHGADGAGSGSDDLAHLHGDRANLTRGPAVTQSDGDLWFWITEGVPGTEMPSFSEAFTEEERWQLVSYLRHLQQAARDAERSGD